MATQTLRFHSVNPFTEDDIEDFEISDEAFVDRALDSADAASRTWSATPVAERSQRLRALASVLRRDVDLHAAAITAEMGKTLREARAEVEKCAFVCEYVADNAAQFLADEPAPSDSPRSLVAYEPLGTVLACMPWNFPYWQVFRCAAPAVGAGNCVVLKHANDVT
ncbi:MAG: aldehyde dehydrogenase family protein, partial [Candidatus Dormibacteraeota bacterium]|nr:aldehyde dehydrogenase family protein [Candidatus Dormibacteraeota bacterium]